MNLKSLQLGQALNLVMRTLPIALVRLGALMLFWLVAIVYLAIIGGVAWLVGQAVPVVGVILFLIGIGGLSPLYRLAKRYALYLIKAAQIAVMAELLARGSLPAGVNQLAWGKQRVQERFGEASIMFVVDEMVNGIVRVFTSMVYSVASWVPGGALRGLANMVNRIIRFAVSYIDEAILARTFWLGSGSVWAHARDGVVLYGMVWKPLLANAVALMLLSYIPFLAAVLIIALPAGLLGSLISPVVAGWAVIACLVLAWLVKMAIGDTFAMAAMISSYMREIEGLEPDPAVTARLEKLSDKFRGLQQRAQEELGSRMGAPGIAPEPPADIPPTTPPTGPESPPSGGFPPPAAD